MSGPSPPTDWAAVPDSAVALAFKELSLGAADTLKAIRLAPGEHLLREDVPEALCRAVGLPALSAADRGAVLAVFRLDASGTISASEFECSWRALQGLQAPAEPQRNSARGGKLRRPAAPPAAAQAVPACQLLTAAAEINWLHAAAGAPLPAQQRCEGVAARYVPLRGSDITRGGEGSSARTYFGMYL